jgi:hypothetical protein
MLEDIFRKFTPPPRHLQHSDEVLTQQTLRYRQTVFTVADRVELSGRLCSKPLKSQAGGNGFDVVRWKLISKTGPLFCIRESLTTDESELLAQTWLMAAHTPGILAITGNQKHTTQGFDAKLSLMIFDEDILHLRRFARYVAAFWKNGPLLVQFSQLAF